MKTIHFTAYVDPRAVIHSGAEVLQFACVREGAEIGEGSRICSHVYVDADVKVGKRCKVKNGACLFKGVVLGNDVFIGPNVTFTNDKNPKAFEKHTPPYPKTSVGDRASIGAGAVILPGLSIGADAVIGAGSVVTKDVPSRSIVYGNPARGVTE